MDQPSELIDLMPINGNSTANGLSLRLMVLSIIIIIMIIPFFNTLRLLQIIGHRRSFESEAEHRVGLPSQSFVNQDAKTSHIAPI